MKTKAQVLRERPDQKVLVNAVINRIGMDSVEDVLNGGIDGGFNGFIYYRDTVSFYKRHKKDILEMARNMANDLGENLMEMIGGFGCLKYYDYKSKKWIDTEGQDAIGETIYGGKVNDVVANALAWFAAEEVCRMFED